MPTDPTQPHPPTRALPTLWAAVSMCVLAFLHAGPLVAQDAASHLSGWYAWEGRWQPEHGRWGVDIDLQLRDFQIADDFAQASIRGGVFAAPTALPLRFTVGGAWFANGRVGEDGPLSVERRLYQTLDFAQPLAPAVRLVHRARAEQRWFEDQGFRTRYRYRLGVETRIAGEGDRALFFIVSDEVLLNGETRLDDGRPIDRLDANRSYLAVNAPLRNATRIEVGYLNVNGGFAPLHRLRITVKTRF